MVLTAIWPFVRLVSGRDRADHAGSAILQRVFRCYLSVLHGLGLFRVRWKDVDALRNLRGEIVVANHPGLLDVVFLLAELPHAVCVMRGSLMRNPAFLGAAKMAGFIRNDRGAEMIRHCVEKLHAGGNLLIFPEGTRTRQCNGVLNPFRAGFALAAVRSGAEVQCIVIDQSQPYLTHGMSVLAPESAPVHLDIRIGERFRARKGETARAFAARVEDYFRGELARRNDENEVE